MIRTRVVAAVVALIGCSRDCASSSASDLRIETLASPAADQGPAAPFEHPRAFVPDSARGAPELPRATIDSREAATPSRGRRIHARTSGALRRALAQAEPGDVILLERGQRYTGNFVLRAVGRGAVTSWIAIRTDGAALPPEGTRITPSAANDLAKLSTPNASPALATEPGARGYRIVGVEIGAEPGVRQVYSLVALGEGGPPQTSEASVPHHIVLDRSYVHGSPSLSLRRCVALNSAWTAVVDSWLSECHSNDGDSQAIWGSNGPGPYRITGNYLEGAGENVMFGGSDAAIRGLIPADIEITRNHLRKPAAWRKVWSVKNLLELKVGRRVLVEGNVMEGTWVDAQAGYAVVLKSVNQDGRATWSQTTDVTFRRNVITQVAAGISMSGAPEANPVGAPLSRVLVEQNLIVLGDPAVLAPGLNTLSRGVLISSTPRDVTLRHNTLAGVGSVSVLMVGPDWGRFELVDNAFGVGGYGGVKGDGSQNPSGPNEGTDILQTYTGGQYRFAGNAVWAPGAVSAAVRGTYPAPNVLLERTSEAQVFPGAAAGDYTLAPARFRGIATDGRDPGADRAALDSATAGVAVSR